MSHWCYPCGKYPIEEEYEKCKEQGHDMDLEDDYRPNRSESGLKPIKITYLCNECDSVLDPENYFCRICKVKYDVGTKP
jgi:hypothetical protein